MRVTPEELRAILEELEGKIDEADHEKLAKLVGRYTYVSDLLREEDMTIERLRRLLEPRGENPSNSPR